MTRAICVPFHQYTNFGHDFYQPLWTHFIQSMTKYRNEYDRLYVVDSNWGIPSGDYTIIQKQHDGHHWVQFKDALPYVQEDAIFFMDNDVVISKPGVIDSWFRYADNGYDVVSAFDGSGSYNLKLAVQKKFPLMKEYDSQRIVSYYFLLTRSLLNKIPDIDFDVKEYEDGTYISEIDYTTKEDRSDSFGYFTIKMMATNPKIKAIDDDRNSIYFDNRNQGEKGKNLGFYHIRAGSSIPYLLSCKHFDHEKTYWEYIDGQPRVEYIRQCAWYKYLGGNPEEIVKDSKVGMEVFTDYYKKFMEYHNL